MDGTTSEEAVEEVCTHPHLEITPIKSERRDNPPQRPKNLIELPRANPRQTRRIEYFHEKVELQNREDLRTLALSTFEEHGETTLSVFNDPGPDSFVFALYASNEGASLYGFEDGMIATGPREKSADTTWEYYDSGFWISMDNGESSITPICAKIPFELAVNGLIYYFEKGEFDPEIEWSSLNDIYWPPQ